jgi:putative membrane protein
MTSKLIVLVAAFAFAAGCKKKEQSAPATAGSGSAADTGSAAAGSGSAAEAPPAAPAFTDPQIAAIVVAANQVDIDAGNLALKKSKNDEVKKFAERMVTDHTAVNKAAVELVTKLKVTPEETDTSKSLTSGGEAKRAELEKLDGDAFDKAYVDNEVAYHEAVIGVLKDKLIPSAQNADLKAALVGAQPAFDAHLQHAKQIQGALASGGSAAHAQHK